MNGRSELPEGFVLRGSGADTLIVRRDLLDPVTAAGLDDPTVWERLLAGPAAGAGRGATAVVDVGGETLRLKQMRRGGLAGPLWRDRFPGTARLLDNLRVPLIAAERGVPTAAPVILVMRQGPPGLYRAWMAFVEIPAATDLLARFRSADPPDESELRVVMRVVRHMHDAGIEHVDLNLGNLLVRDGVEGREAFVIDLDRGRVRDTGVGEARRLVSLRRLERSYRKNFPAAPAPLWCYRLYAEDDPARIERYLPGRG